MTVPATTTNASDRIPDDEDLEFAEALVRDVIAAMDATMAAAPGGVSEDEIRTAGVAAILPLLAAHRAEIEHRAAVRGADEAEHWRQLWRDGWLDDPRVPMECNALQANEWRHVREHRISELRARLEEMTEQRDRAEAAISKILKESDNA